MASFDKRRAQDAGFQYGLRDLFMLLLLNAVYFALVRGLGACPATLALGLFLLGAVVVLLRLENMLFGGLVGGFLACVILSGTLLAFGAGGDGAVVLLCFAYPLLGYVLGLVCVAHQQMRLGL